MSKKSATHYTQAEGAPDMHFGEHVTIDGYKGSTSLLNDEKLIRNAVQELCALLKMQPLGKVQVVSAPDNHFKDPGGWSAFVIIAESHISIHTFPRRGFVSADVYTCRNGIDVDFIRNFFRKTFKLKDIETHFIRRGTKYPQHNIA